jgi:hypothetical protein
MDSSHPAFRLGVNQLVGFWRSAEIFEIPPRSSSVVIHWKSIMEPNVFFSGVDSFVKWSGGDHAINTILIANNGIGATKVSDNERGG